MSYKNKIITVTAEKIVFPGNVLCRCEDGIALFTENLLPGEKAEILVTRDKKSFREGRVAKIIKMSELRKNPQCNSFGKCGGCSFQHTDYKNQLNYKTECVKELLNFTRHDVNDAEASPEEWNYRNKMEFSFFNDNDGNLDLGLHCKGSFYKYSSVPPCFIADKDIMKTVDIVKDFAVKSGLKAYHNKSHSGFFRHLSVRKGVNTKETLVNIVTNADSNINKDSFDGLTVKLSGFCTSIYWTQNSKLSDAVNCDSKVLLYGKENIHEQITVHNRKFDFSIAPFSFFQTNTKATEVLYNKIIDCLNLGKEDVVLDLYCGTGTIGICAAPHVKEVVGVEQAEESIRNANENASANNITNISFFALTAEKWIEQNGKHFTSVVVDPPRMGLAPQVIEHILKLDPKRIIYVSCNPSTLARDLKIIFEKSSFKIKHVYPVDMFPQTYHIETVVCLESGKYS